MELIATKLPEVKIIVPKAFSDPRGFFFESFRSDRYSEMGVSLPFVQDNISRSHQNTLRGLHYQLRFPQGKLVTVVNGKVFDVAIDIRIGSLNFGKWIGVVLSDENHRQLYIPPGFAHGFYVLSEFADFHYKCTDYYHSEDEYGIIWHDIGIGIEWPFYGLKPPIISEKDSKFKNLKEVPQEFLPRF